MQLQGLQVGQGQEDLLPQGPQLVVVDVDGLDAVAQVEEGLSVDGGDKVVGDVDGLEVAELGELEGVKRGDLERREFKIKKVDFSTIVYRVGQK